MKKGDARGMGWCGKSNGEIPDEWPNPKVWRLRRPASPRVGGLLVAGSGWCFVRFLPLLRGHA